MFPSLIAKLVLSHLPGILKPNEKTSANPEVFTTDHKLFAPSMVNDLEEDIQFGKKMATATVPKGPDGDHAKLLAAIDEELEHLSQTIQQHVARKKALIALAREISYPLDDDVIEVEDESASSQEQPC